MLTQVTGRAFQMEDQHVQKVLRQKALVKLLVV